MREAAAKTLRVFGSAAAVGGTAVSVGVAAGAQPTRNRANSKINARVRFIFLISLKSGIAFFSLPYPDQAGRRPGCWNF
jgi:hypothetical protein